MNVISGLDFARPIERYVEALGHGDFPAAAVAACLMRYDEAGPLLVALLERAVDGALADSAGVAQVYHALYVTAGARDQRAFPLVLRLIHRAQHDRDPLLDRVGATLPRLAISTFDGDCEALFTTILNREASVFFRCAVFDATTYLTWEGRIERGRMVEFLVDFQTVGLDPEHELLWLCWARSISLLGLDELEPAALAAWEDDLLPEYLDRDRFAQTLAEAKAMPRDPHRFEPKNLGHLDDVLGTLQNAFDRTEGKKEEGGKWEDRDFNDAIEAVASRRPITSAPAVNPTRHVGRNDSCPCGSGKKAKRCCLAA